MPHLDQTFVHPETSTYERTLRQGHVVASAVAGEDFVSIVVTDAFKPDQAPVELVLSRHDLTSFGLELAGLGLTMGPSRP